MYSQRDMDEIKGKILKNWLVLCPILAAILAVYVWALVSARKWLAMTAGPLLFVAACYGVLAYLAPNTRYKNFLLDMQNGLSREVRGEVLEIADAAEPQDGAMVLPVRLRLDDEGEEGAKGVGESVSSRRLRLEDAEDGERERIVYLNASKRGRMPGPGTRVALRCCGRHILEAEAV